MTFDYTRIPDPEFFAENRMAAHSDHRWFRTLREADGGPSSFETNLNGTWKFHYAPNIAAAPRPADGAGFDDSGWGEIQVPGHIQLQGFGRPQYSNVQHPWDGHETLEPGQVPQRFNPVATYATTFRAEPLGPGERLSVAFHGAESSVAVWLNGTYIGYGCDTFTPSEFDLTRALVEGENTLAAQVFTWSGASWIEDQDFFRFSGLFRDVILYRRPAVHVNDLKITSDLSADFNAATIAVELDIQGEGTVSAVLAGVGELVPDGDGLLTIEVPAPRLWSAENPYLYGLTIEVTDARGEIVEVIPQRVGIRRVEIVDSVIMVNGRRIVFNGVNRHDFGKNGRAVTREEIEADILTMKSLNINAVRTSHYPNNSVFYELCDLYGLYVIDEMNLESHGIWDKIRRGDLSIDEAVPGDKPEWLAPILDRAASMLERDKNHPSIVMWSCGNESFGGTNILAAADYFRRVDSRIVHYEGCYWDQRYTAITDVFSAMYVSAAEAEEYLQTHRDKPYIMCEYAHAMGNSFGAVDKYVDLAYRDPLFQGGFIWDFADQAIEMTAADGRSYFGYGGDFGDAPHDGDFSGNGILFADHTPKPFAAEVAYQYQGFKISVERSSVTIENRFMFTDSSQYECVVSWSRNGVKQSEGTIETAVPPGEAGTYSLPFEVPSEHGEYAVDVSFRERAATAWAPAGHEVAWQQRVFDVPAPAEVERGPAPQVERGIHNIGVRGDKFLILFSTLYGGLASYRVGEVPQNGRELLTAPPVANFWHAPTSNERGWGMPFRDGQWRLASLDAKLADVRPTVVETGHSVVIAYTYLLPTSPESQCDVTYEVFADGRIAVELTVRPGDGLPDMPEFGMQLCAPAELTNLRWYGDGPQECYVDRRGSARLGIYDADVREQLAKYLRPQESGSHTGVRWADVTDDDGTGLRFECVDGMEFSALPWTPFEIENARHHVDLPPIRHTVIRPALMRRGVGGDDSWQAMTHPEYRLPAGQELTFRFSVTGLQ